MDEAWVCGLLVVTTVMAGCASSGPEAGTDLGKRVLDLSDGAGVYFKKVIEGRLVIDGKAGDWGPIALGDVERRLTLAKPSFQDGGGVRRDLWEGVNATLEVRPMANFSPGPRSLGWFVIKSLEELKFTSNGLCSISSPPVVGRTTGHDSFSYALQGPGILGVGVQLSEGEQRVALLCHLFESVVTFKAHVESAIHPSTVPPHPNGIDEFGLTMTMASGGYDALLPYVTRFSATTTLKSSGPTEGNHAGLEVVQADYKCTKNEPASPTSTDWTSQRCTAPGIGPVQVRVGAIPNATYENVGPVKYWLDVELIKEAYKEGKP